MSEKLLYFLGVFTGVIITEIILVLYEEINE